MIAKAKPKLKRRIDEALRDADITQYADSMRPLVQGGIVDALAELDHV